VPAAIATLLSMLEITERRLHAGVEAMEYRACQRNAARNQRIAQCIPQDVMC
jgi:hypothetical protein